MTFTEAELSNCSQRGEREGRGKREGERYSNARLREERGEKERERKDQSV